MPRVRRRRGQVHTLTEFEWAYLNDMSSPEGGGPEGTALGRWELDCDFGLMRGRHGARVTTALWAEFGPTVLQRWVLEKPGTRPSCWWRFEAPEGRLRVGGAGETINSLGQPGDTWLRFGIPVCWLSQELAAYYAKPAPIERGRYVGPPGSHVPSNYRPPDGQPFDCVGFDPEDPPLFEAQAAYLRRLDLLAPGEAERLTDADFAPEAAVFFGNR